MSRDLTIYQGKLESALILRGELGAFEGIRKAADTITNLAVRDFTLRHDAKAKILRDIADTLIEEANRQEREWRAQNITTYDEFITELYNKLES